MSDRVVVDKGGRIVIPKPLRQSLGEEGDLLVIEQRDGGLMIHPEEMEGGLITRDEHLFKPKLRGARTVSTDDVSQLLGAQRLRGMPRRKKKAGRRKSVGG